VAADGRLVVVGRNERRVLARARRREIRGTALALALWPPARLRFRPAAILFAQRRLLSRRHPRLPPPLRPCSISPAQPAAHAVCLHGPRSHGSSASTPRRAMSSRRTRPRRARARVRSARRPPLPPLPLPLPLQRQPQRPRPRLHRRRRHPSLTSRSRRPPPQLRPTSSRCPFSRTRSACRSALPTASSLGPRCAAGLWIATDGCRCARTCERCAGPALLSAPLTSLVASVKEATQGYFHDFHKLRSHGGKTWRAPGTLIRDDVRDAGVSCVASRRSC